MYAISWSLCGTSSAAYFAGDRTEEEVLKNIQNRAGNIIKEMS